MALNNSQKQIAQTIIDVGRQVGATSKQIRAALATGYVETKFQNLSYGMDGDNKGVFQQRNNWGSVAERMNVSTAAKKFYAEAKRVDTASLTAGQLAQKVQRSGVPTAYTKAMPFIDATFGMEGSVSQPDSQSVSDIARAAADLAFDDTTGAGRIGVGGVVLGLAAILIVGKIIHSQSEEYYIE